MKVIEYILIKLAALGLLVGLMATYLLFLTKFDLYEFTEYLGNLKIWGLLCGYALLTSMLIDWIRHQSIPFKFKTYILLHGLAGFIAFFPFGINVFSVIAGFVGALCAIIYAFSSYLFTKKKSFAWIPLLVFPILLLVRPIDFTSKEEWSEKKTDSSYLASFERLHGEHEIPLALNEGDQVNMYLTLHNLNGGGYGYGISDPLGHSVGMEEMNESDGESEPRAFQFSAKQTGVYAITVSGDDLRGKIEVKWEIENR